MASSGLDAQECHDEGVDVLASVVNEGNARKSSSVGIDAGTPALAGNDSNPGMPGNDNCH
jgi:hypothetical protein